MPANKAVAMVTVVCVVPRKTYLLLANHTGRVCWFVWELMLCGETSASVTRFSRGRL